MDPRIQEMLDHHEIRRTLAIYCHACDRGDADLMANVYTGAESFDDHGRVKASGPEYARAMTQIIRERTDAIWHSLGQSLIQVDGDEASAETFFLAWMRLPGTGNAPRLNQLAGRFLDRLHRIDGSWKIHHRTCVRDTSISLPVFEDDYADFNFVQGTRDTQDLGVAMLGLAHQATLNRGSRSDTERDK
ncbi:MAG TPA: nuclear transport factor 2 family protein [Sphingobium sp.]|uniref:nuclear transport factor 2 family protein n=1 Tax=Sphingobium sp. TaxID=1912891 RepID=UPI002ED481F9